MTKSDRLAKQDNFLLALSNLYLHYKLNPDLAQMILTDIYAVEAIGKEQKVWANARTL